MVISEDLVYGKKKSNPLQKPEVSNSQNAPVKAEYSFYTEAPSQQGDFIKSMYKSMQMSFIKAELEIFGTAFPTRGFRILS